MRFSAMQLGVGVDGVSKKWHRVGWASLRNHPLDKTKMAVDIAGWNRFYLFEVEEPTDSSNFRDVLVDRNASGQSRLDALGRWVKFLEPTRFLPDIKSLLKNLERLSGPHSAKSKHALFLLIASYLETWECQYCEEIDLEAVEDDTKPAEEVQAADEKEAPASA